MISGKAAVKDLKPEAHLIFRKPKRNQPHDHNLNNEA
jgi:hypothetical protein